MRNHWIWILSSVVTGWLLLVYLFFSENGYIPGIEHAGGYLMAAVAAIIAAYIIRWVNRKLDQRVPWRQYFTLRFGLALITGVGIIVAVIFAFVLLNSLFITDLLTYALHDAGELWIRLVILSFVVLFVFQAGYFGIYSYQQYAVYQLQKFATEREQLKLQYEALRSQLSPHFLFNSLNTISSLVHKNPDDAEEFIRRLARTYQYVISNKKQRLVPLAQELEFIKSYYHLLKVRFENALKLDINIPDSLLSTEIPPMTLQILIENAVKHNRVDSEHPLEIYIGCIDNTYLKITNNKAEAVEQIRSFRVGLNNIKKRYAFYSEKSVKVTDDAQFRVELPVLKQQAS